MADMAEAQRLRDAGLRLDDLEHGLHLTSGELRRLQLRDFGRRRLAPFAALASRLRRRRYSPGGLPVNVSPLTCPYCQAEPGHRHEPDCEAI